MKLRQDAWSRVLVQLIAVLWVAALPLTACSGGGNLTRPGNTPTPFAATLTPFQPLPPTEVFEMATPSPAASLPPSEPGGVWLAPYLPVEFVQRISSVLLAASRDTSEFIVEAAETPPAGTGEHLTSRWVYALVAPFPTIVEGVSLSDIQARWRGEPAGPFGRHPLWMDESTYRVWAVIWGEAAPGSVQVVSAEVLLESAWSNRPAWGLVPFEDLEPRWKVMAVDGISPLSKTFDPTSYGLAVVFWLHPAGSQTTVLLDERPAWLPASNRDPDQLTVLAMTGVTALVRCTASLMERHGYDYPGRSIRDILRSADLTHISNEIPFSPGCPLPNCYQQSLLFCSNPNYIQLLEDIGVDLVELTGDHFGDWGAEAMLYTLDLYRERGWLYYGGGANRQEAQQAVTLTHNGNRLAFIGCNAKRLANYATASDINPGAVSCNYPYLREEIARLREEGYLVIASFQHEEYYTYTVGPQMQQDFREMAEAGAVIVSGSQAHQPHGIEFYDQAFIHFGLGNLFFDQLGHCPDDACGKAFIDQHIFYAGRYISTELIPLRFVDLARPRPMTADEAAQLLETVFSASGW